MSGTKAASLTIGTLIPYNGGMNGLVGYGAYLPYWRLSRAAVATALGDQAEVKGQRAVASYDEDTTSMGAEAGRLALRHVPGGYEPASLWFATTSPGYLDKTNATAIHAALRLPDSAAAFDVLGGVRSGLGAADAALRGAGIAILSDIRTGLPGSPDESGGGDAAVALAFGDEDAIAVPVATASSTGEFLERWRRPGDPYSRVWEERFGEHAYQQHVRRAIDAAVKEAGIMPGDLDHVVVSGLHRRATRQAVAAVGCPPGAVADDLTAAVGNPGAAHWALVLADVLDRAQPDQTIAVITLADGCHVAIWRTTPSIAARRSPRSTRDAIAGGRGELSYLRFLTWRGMLDREPPRRPEPDQPAAPPALRTAGWKFSFAGSQDESGNRHLPPARVSYRTGSVDRMIAAPMADVPGTIVTFTVDRLTYSPSPPLVAAVIDFDGGGRFPCELTDVDPDAVRVGDRVEMTFRRLYSAGGVHNYFWKARPRVEPDLAKAG